MHAAADARAAIEGVHVRMQRLIEAQNLGCMHMADEAQKGAGVHA
jgi:hypothetical protein